MAKQIGEDTKVTLDLKTIGMLLAGAVSLALMYFTLQADIALAKDVEAMREQLDKIDERLYEMQKR